MPHGTSLASRHPSLPWKIRNLISYLLLLLCLQGWIPLVSESMAEDQSGKEPPDTLRVIAHIATSWVVGNSVVEPLVYVDNENRFIPSLAEQWTFTPEYVDLQLRRGVVFHDGTQFNSVSVRNNWERYVATASSQAPYYTLDLRLAVRDVEPLDDYLVRMHFHKGGFVGQMLVYLRSFYMYSPAYFSAFEGRYPQGNQANILRAGPWGTGPYRIMEIQNDGAVSLLRANSDYWQKGYPRTANLQIFSPAAVDGTDAYQWMIDGKADLFDAVSPSMLPLLRKHENLQRAISYPTSHLTTLFNTRKPNSPLGDIRVREALNLMVDRRTLHRFVSHESARMVAFILPLEEAKGLQPYPYDPQRAARLLQEAGFDEKNPLPLRIGYYISEEKLARAIGAMLDGKGIAIEYEQYRTRQEYYKHIKNYTHGPDNPIEGELWDLSIVQSGLYTNTVATHFEAFYGEGGNRWIEVDEEADRLFLKAMRAVTLEEAQQGFAEMESYLYQHHYSMPLFIWPSIFAMHQRIAANSFSASGYLLNLKEIAIAR
jgi:ABC-type transport system substrate-binding protein